MAFQTPLTIKEVIDKIHRREYLLPSIQREYVWKPKQVIGLFDSLLKEYPINSFLFWKVQRTNVSEYVFYEFIRDYNELNSFRTIKADVTGEREITAILDGQQRLTSIYIALKGSYASFKKYCKSRKEASCYPAKKLYLNLLNELDEDNKDYDLQFFEQHEIKNNQTKFWFPISQILELHEQSEVNDYLNQNLMYVEDNDLKRFASRTLFKLHKVIWTSPLVSYFLEEDSELDKVLNIFIRVNSGGTQLSPTDLLFSFANSHWTDINFKDSVNTLVDELNNTGLGYRIDKDFVMKSLLYLSDVPDISAKIGNFTSTNMGKFKDNWNEIKEALKTTFKLVSSLGFNYTNVASNMIYHPIAYYIFKNKPKNIETNINSEQIRNQIRKWIASTSLKRFFSFAPDGALRPIRTILSKDITKEFPIETIKENFRGTNRSLIFSEDDIAGLLSYRKNDSRTFNVLSILYPNLNYRDNFHIDHIFPISKMSEQNLTENNIPQELHFTYKLECDKLSNLQLLEGSINLQKSNMDFNLYYDTINDKHGYSQKHFIPDIKKYNIEDFKEFYDARLNILKSKLREELS